MAGKKKKTEAEKKIDYRPAPKKPKMFYVWQVAEALNVSEKHLKTLIENGQLEAVNISATSRKVYRIPQESFEKFKRERSSLKESAA